MNSYIKHFLGISLLFCLLTIGLFSFQSSFSQENSCKYQSKIDSCIASDAPRSIQDFVCIQGNKEEVTYQIVLDEKFKELDKEVDKYLTFLETNKSYYFGKDKQENHIDGIDDIMETFKIGGTFYTKFQVACGKEIIVDSAACLPDSSTSNSQARDYFNQQGTLCMRLVEDKLQLAREVAFDILNLNKHAVRNDEFKLYQQKERTKYDELLNNMMLNQGYMTDILQRTPSLTKNTY